MRIIHSGEFLPLGFLMAMVTAAFVAVGRAEIIDRIAVSVDNQVITESRLLQEIRLTAFVNSEKPDFSPDARRKAAGRLVEQALIRREMDLAHYPEPAPAEIDKMLAQVKSRFASGAQYQTALREYSITEVDLRQFLLRQATTLRFIEYRFRPEVFVSEEEIRACYDTRVVPGSRKQNGKEPTFEEARDQCEQAVAAERVDKLVDRWVQEARDRANIVYQEDAFR